MKKHRYLVALAVMLLVSLTLPWALCEEMAAADLTGIGSADQGLRVTGVTQDESTHALQISLENAFPGSDQMENYAVTIGGNKATISDLQAGEAKATDAAEAPAVVNAGDKRTSWIFLCDVATVSTNGDKKIPLKETLKNLITLVGYYDNGAVVTTKSSVPEQGLSSGATLDANIEVVSDKGITSFFSGVAKTLDYISDESTSGQLLDNVCLVILSTGKLGYVTDNNMQEKVLNKIGANNVSVYTIAFSSDPDYTFTEMAKQSADSGHGGGSIDMGSAANIEKEAANLIRAMEMSKVTLQTAQEMAHVALTVDQPENRGLDDNIRVTFKSGDMEISTSYLPETPIVYPEQGFFQKLVSGLQRGEIKSVAIVAVAVVLLVLIIALLIRLIGGRKQPKSENYNQGEVVPPPTAPASNVTDATVVSTPEPVARSRRLQLTLRESGGKVHRAMMSPDGVTAGRQGDNHVVLDSSDKHISRHHFVLRQKGEDVLLENISETNGTYVNGMRADGPVALRQQDVIRVGSTEMTITWKYE